MLGRVRGVVRGYRTVGNEFCGLAADSPVGSDTHDEEVDLGVVGCDVNTVSVQKSNSPSSACTVAVTKAMTVGVESSF